MSNDLAMSERQAFCEQMLITMLPPTVVQRRVAEKYNVTHRTVRNDIAAIRTRWAEAADPVDKKKHRDEMIASARGVFAQSMTKRSTVGLSKDDKPVTVPDPNLTTACRSLEILKSLYGLDVLKIEDVTPKRPDVTQLPPKARAKLREVIDIVAETPTPKVKALADGRQRKTG